MANPTKSFKIEGLISDKEYAALPFGRQIEYYKAFNKFKSEAKSDWISQKVKDGTSEINKFIRSVNAKEYYVCYYDKKKSPEYWDDSFQIWYKV